jgi:hypothetical protein
MKVLIVEDEPKTAQDLSETRQEIDPTIQIRGIMDSIEGGTANLFFFFLSL